MNSALRSRSFVEPLSRSLVFPAVRPSFTACIRGQTGVLLAAGFFAASGHAQPGAAAVDWQRVGNFSIARTETTVAQFSRFVAATNTVTQAERDGGGLVYEAGFVKKPGWTWRTPFGKAAAGDEPAVHVNFHEAQAFCRWAGGGLPTDAQWVSAAYTEQRAQPAPGFIAGRTYTYPTGDTPAGAQCLGDCGPASRDRATAQGARLLRGHGHARVTATPAGVNGLHDMGANAWEWVDEPAGAAGNTPRRTRGGSWWYGEGPMRVDQPQEKQADMAVVYIGFRCARDT